MKVSNIFALTISILCAQLAGIIGSVFTTSSVTGWYTTLATSSLNPPGWVFAPVWTTLYILMGIAAFLVWKKGVQRKDVYYALGAYLIQLILNVLWSVLFFGFQNPAAALIEISTLWFAIFVTIVLFSRISKIAAWLLVPYILWVSFAAYLNYIIWILN